MSKIHVNYFAYASNLSEAQMEERDVPFETRRRAVLPDHTLAFNKRATNYEGYAAANIKEQPGSIVEGVVYEVTFDALTILDTFEEGYDKVTKHVTLEDTSTREVIVYQSAPNFILPGNDNPISPVYAKRILSGGQTAWSDEYLTRMKARLRKLARPPFD